MKRIFFLLVAGLILLSACSSNKQESKEAKPSSQVQPLSAADSAKYLELGDDLVSTTKQKISTTLVEAMEKGGVKYAAQFCNLVAYPIVDSLSKVHNARIRRVSNKPRNPKDAMDEEERKVFAMFAAQLQQPNAEVNPILLQHSDGTVSYYTPIKISMPTCLKCHGEVGKDVKPEDYAEIKKLYSNDNAIGYKQGDLRGMFSIRFINTHSH
jgi:outer membrane murein-binding lipoprotein Lpp